MSLRLLKKQIGETQAQASAESKAVTEPSSRGTDGHGRIGNRPNNRSAGYYSGVGTGGSPYPDDKAGGGYYGNRSDNGNSEESSYYGSGGASGSASGAGGNRIGHVQGPMGGGGGNFRGSSTQAAHVEAMKKAMIQEAKQSSTATTSDVAVRSGLGLAAVRERKAKEDAEREAKREAARAKRRNEATRQEAEDDQALAECEAQARMDSDTHDGVKYEAALIVRIANRFGSSGVWIKIAEARARGAEIPLDPRRIYLLAHPDKCRLPEASDATAILNAQRPPEMTEVKARPARPAGSVATDNMSAAPVPAEEDAVGEHPSEAFEVRPPNARAARNISASEDELRIDPEDNKECTLQELRKKYEGMYSPEEIDEYWTHECRKKPVRFRC